VTRTAHCEALDCIRSEAAPGTHDDVQSARDVAMIVRCRQRAPEPSSPGVWRTRSSPASGMSALVDRAVAPWIVDRGGCAPSPGRSGRSIAARRLTDRASSPGFIELAMHAVAQPFCLLEAMGRQEDRDARSRSPSISSCTSRAATGSSPEDSWIVQQRPRRARPVGASPSTDSCTDRPHAAQGRPLGAPGRTAGCRGPVEAGEMKDTPSTAIRSPNCFARPSTTIAAPPPPEATVIGVGPRR